MCGFQRNVTFSVEKIVLFGPNKINVLFPVTCWEKRGSDGRKNIYFKEIFYNLNSDNNL